MTRPADDGLAALAAVIVILALFVPVLFLLMFLIQAGVIR